MAPTRTPWRSRCPRHYPRARSGSPTTSRQCSCNESRTRHPPSRYLGRCTALVEALVRRRIGHCAPLFLKEGIALRGRRGSTGRLPSSCREAERTRPWGRSMFHRPNVARFLAPFHCDLCTSAAITSEVGGRPSRGGSVPVFPQWRAESSQAFLCGSQDGFRRPRGAVQWHGLPSRCRGFRQVPASTRSSALSRLQARQRGAVCLAGCVHSDSQRPKFRQQTRKVTWREPIGHDATVAVPAVEVCSIPRLCVTAQGLVQTPVHSHCPALPRGRRRRRLGRAMRSMPKRALTKAEGQVAAGAHVRYRTDKTHSTVYKYGAQKVLHTLPGALASAQ